MNEQPIDYVKCVRGDCHFYKRRDAQTLCRCSAQVLGKLEEDLSVRLLNVMADQLTPERVQNSGLTTSEAA